MKTLIVSDFYYPGNSRLLEVYGGGLQNRGHTVSLIAGSTNPEEHRKPLQERSVEPMLYPYSSSNPLSDFVTTLRNVAERYDTLVESQGVPDAVLFHQPLSAIPVVRVLPDSTDAIYVHHGPWAEEWAVHHPTDDNPLKRIVKWPYRSLQQFVRHRTERWVLNRMDRVVVLSRYMQNKVLDNHPSAVRTSPTVIPGGTDPNHFTPDDRERSRRELDWTNRTIVFTLRRLIYRMGVDRLIEAFGKLLSRPDSPDDLHLIIGGTGPEQDALEDLANSINSERISLVGYVEEENLPDYYRAADLFVLPTRTLEGFGLVTLEALASGTPVVATRTGGTQEILGKLDEALFLPEYSPKSWANHLKNILTSDRINSEFRQKCRKFVLENYTWDHCLDQLDRFLRTV